MEAVFARRGKHAALAVRNDDTQLGSIDDVAEFYLLLINAVRHPFAAVIITALNEQALVPSEVTARIHRGIFPPALMLAAARAHALVVGLVEPLVGKRVECHSKHGFRHIERHGDGIRRTVDRAERCQLAFAVIEVDGIVGVVEREVDAARIAARDHRAALGERARHRDGQNAVFAAVRIDHGIVIALALEAEDKAVADNELERTEGRTVVNAVKLHSAFDKRLLTKLSELHRNVADFDFDGLLCDGQVEEVGRVDKLEVVIFALIVSEFDVELEGAGISSRGIAGGIDVAVDERQRYVRARSGGEVVDIADRTIYGLTVAADADLLVPNQSCILRDDVIARNVVYRVAVGDRIIDVIDHLHSQSGGRDDKFGINAVVDQARGLVEVRVAAVNNDRIISSDVGRGVRSVHRGELITRVSFGICFEPLSYRQRLIAFKRGEISRDELLNSRLIGSAAQIIYLRHAARRYASAVKLVSIDTADGVAACPVVNGGIALAREPDPQIRLFDRYRDKLRRRDVIVRAARDGDGDIISTRVAHEFDLGLFDGRARAFVRVLIELSIDIELRRSGKSRRRHHFAGRVVSDLEEGVESELHARILLSVQLVDIDDVSRGADLGHGEGEAVRRFALEVVVRGDEGDTVLTDRADRAAREHAPSGLGGDPVLHFAHGERVACIIFADRLALCILILQAEHDLREEIVRPVVTRAVCGISDYLLICDIFARTVRFEQEFGRGGSDHDTAVGSFHDDFEIGVLGLIDIIDIVVADGRLVAAVFGRAAAGSSDKLDEAVERALIPVVLEVLESGYEVIIRTGDDGVFARFKLDLELILQAAHVKLRTELNGEVCACGLGDHDMVFSLLLHEIAGIGISGILAGHAVEGDAYPVRSRVGDAAVLAAVSFRVNNVTLRVGYGDMQIARTYPFVIISADGIVRALHVAAVTVAADYAADARIGDQIGAVRADRSFQIQNGSIGERFGSDLNAANIEVGAAEQFVRKLNGNAGGFFHEFVKLFVAALKHIRAALIEVGGIEQLELRFGGRDIHAAGSSVRSVIGNGFIVAVGHDLSVFIILHGLSGRIIAAAHRVIHGNGDEIGRGR